MIQSVKVISNPGRSLGPTTPSPAAGAMKKARMDDTPSQASSSCAPSRYATHAVLCSPPPRSACRKHAEARACMARF